jgi:predicted protein tyrosine phosphatase
MHDVQAMQSPSQSPAAEARNGRIHVCPISAVPDMLRRTRARHLVTVINSQMMPATPDGFDQENHLRLALNDIIAPLPGMVCPGPEHVGALITFVRRWNHDGALLIHCHAGVSRSPAAAFIALCALNPEVQELELASRLRQASPTAIPNALMVELADELLARGGRMIEAIERMGMVDLAAAEALPFAIASRHA